MSKAGKKKHKRHEPEAEETNTVYTSLAARTAVVSNEITGKLIVVEGVDGSGKSTQMYLLKRWLEIGGYNVYFSEWNSSVLVKPATKRGKNKHILTPTTFSLIHATDFADRYERQILPALKAGYIVLCDRYIYTAYARDAARDCNRNWLRNLYSFAVKPDIALYFHVPLEIALHRILEGRPELKWFEAGMDLNLHTDPTESYKLFSARIAREYLHICHEEGLIAIDATQPVDVQQSEMRKIVSDRIKLKRFHKKHSDPEGQPPPTREAVPTKELAADAEEAEAEA
ncbi:MAG: dTMP kinase [Planctomycetota bacterium]